MEEKDLDKFKKQLEDTMAGMEKKKKEDDKKLDMLLADAEKSVARNRARYRMDAMLTKIMGFDLPFRHSDLVEKLEKQYGKSIELQAGDLAIRLNEYGKDKLKVLMLALAYCTTVCEMQAIQYKSAELVTGFAAYAGRNIDDEDFFELTKEAQKKASLEDDFNII